jgi:ArsR family metal-binding transcriptional regulator
MFSLWMLLTYITTVGPLIAKMGEFNSTNTSNVTREIDQRLLQLDKLFPPTAYASLKNFLKVMGRDTGEVSVTLCRKLVAR